MKKIIVALLLTTQTSWASSATLPATSFTPQQKRVVASYSTWESIKADLKTLESRFKNPRLTEDQKIDLLPVTNQLLSLMQDLTFNEQEKLDSIATVVQLMAASVDYDFASSNQDTLYFDYARFKTAYLQEIAKLPRDKGSMIRDIFADLEEVANNPHSEIGEE